MRTTVTLKDDLVAQAQEISGIKEKSALMNEALTRMIRQEAARRLILLGGTDPDAWAAPRKRWKLDGSGLEET